MSAQSKCRGNNIIFKNNKWYYEETNIPITDLEMSCKYCNKKATKEGHDGCLGALIGVMNACCGHGIESEAYVQFLDGKSIIGKDAITIMKILRKYSKNY